MRRVELHRNVDHDAERVPVPPADSTSRGQRVEADQATDGAPEHCEDAAGGVRRKDRLDNGGEHHPGKCVAPVNPAEATRGVNDGTPDLNNRARRSGRIGGGRSSCTGSHAYAVPVIRRLSPI